MGDQRVVRYSDHFNDGEILFEQIKNIRLEGIVAKLKNSPYIPDDRSKKWLKVTTEKRQEFVIGGWVESEKRNTFRRLLPQLSNCLPIIVRFHLSLLSHLFRYFSLAAF